MSIPPSKRMLYIGWTEDVCKRLDAFAQEDHSYVASRQERERNEHGRKISLIKTAKELVGPLRSRADILAALRKFREVKQEAAEAGRRFYLTIRPDLQIRQCRGQQFQQHKDPTTDHKKSDLATCSAEQSVAWSADPNTGWIWLPSSASWSSSSTPWWPSTGRQRWSVHFIRELFSKSPPTRNSDSFVSDGCKHDTVPRARCARNIFSRVAQECSVTQSVYTLKQLFITLPHHFSLTLVVV